MRAELAQLVKVIYALEAALAMRVVRSNAAQARAVIEAHRR